MYLNRYTPAFRECYEEWLDDHSLTREESVGCLQGDIVHLWHGSMGNRRYTERIRALRENQYDPASDISIDRDNSLWMWSSNKPAMHNAVAKYFVSRDEDATEDSGDTATTESPLAFDWMIEDIEDSLNQWLNNPLRSTVSTRRACRIKASTHPSTSR
ncbi:MAG: hypothetical protein HC841_00425 [Verrucomicrobiae bacterium]|nr:hypothetical protein [Verrucomicrobiae bacterium]